MPRSPKAGKPAHKPTQQLRHTVETLSGLGIRQVDICTAIGIGSKNTLEKYYRSELDGGMVKSRSRVAQTLYQMATSGKDFSATKYWLQQQGGEGWQEKNLHEVTGADGAPLTFTLNIGDARGNSDDDDS